ncbi:hypothetical protein [Glaciibacter superstes]|uniref:hypothetical protein n=1 Tax=Glaciibacter superstes TaxID=501023 RepID=UPI0004206CCA|nr:hypothetical protein [Glaciibacter superstes]
MLRARESDPDARVRLERLGLAVSAALSAGAVLFVGIGLERYATASSVREASGATIQASPLRPSAPPDLRVGALPRSDRLHNAVVTSTR